MKTNITRETNYMENKGGAGCLFKLLILIIITALITIWRCLS